MVYLGAPDTVVSEGPARGSCDLYSSRYIGWVDNSRGNLDVDAVEKAARLAAADGRRPLIFLRGGVRPVAQQSADALGVALLNYRARDSALDGRSKLGREIVASGLTAR
jgi:predicted RecB family endonuclease